MKKLGCPHHTGIHEDLLLVLLPQEPVTLALHPRLLVLPVRFDAPVHHPVQLVPLQVEPVRAVLPVEVCADSVSTSFSSSVSTAALDGAAIISRVCYASARRRGPTVLIASSACTSEMTVVVLPVPGGPSTR